MDKQEKSKGPGGRPTKYNSMMLAKAIKYIDEWKDKGDAVPTVVGLAMACEVATNTIYNWVEKGIACDQFMSIFTRVEQEQHQALVNNGLFGTFNPAITKMMLTKHGYSDKQEIDHRSGDQSMSPTRTAEDMTDDELAAIIAGRGS